MLSQATFPVTDAGNAPRLDLTWRPFFQDPGMSEIIVPGQRYLCEPEPELGLGLVTAVDARSVSLVFPAQGVERRYARHNAPLRRIRHVPGDRIRDTAGKAWTVEVAHENGGLYHYSVVGSGQGTFKYIAR